MSEPPRVGAHPHYLGSWDPTVSLRVRDVSGAFRPADEAERAALLAPKSSVQVLTTPAWLRRELESLDWAGEGEGDARERELFAQYTGRVLAWLRFVGLAVGAACQVQLCATTTHELEGGVVNAVAEASQRALLNVGEEALTVTLGERFAVVLRAGEGCVLAAGAALGPVLLAPGDELGLYLSVNG